MARGPESDRAACARRRPPHLRQDCAALGLERRPSAFLRHHHRRSGERQRRHPRARASRTASTFANSLVSTVRRVSASAATRRRRRQWSKRSGARSASSPTKAAKRRRRARQATRCAFPPTAPRSGFLTPSGLPSVSIGNRTAALHAPACGPRSGARPQHDPARLVHDEAQCHDRDDSTDLARVRQSPSVCAGIAGARATPPLSPSSTRCSARSRVTTRFRSSPIRARRENMPVCLPSVPTTAAAGMRIARCA